MFYFSSRLLRGNRWKFHLRNFTVGLHYSIFSKNRRKNEQQVVLRSDFTQKGRNSKLRTKLEAKVPAQHRLDG